MKLKNWLENLSVLVHISLCGLGSAGVNLLPQGKISVVSISITLSLEACCNV